MPEGVRLLLLMSGNQQFGRGNQRDGAADKQLEHGEAPVAAKMKERRRRRQHAERQIDFAEAARIFAEGAYDAGANGQPPL